MLTKNERYTRRLLAAVAAGSLLLAAGGAMAEDVRIEVRASEVIQHLGRTLTGVCIEDVNHEIYGGLYSQMIFGESFQEPAGLNAGLSREWHGFSQGTAMSETRLETRQPFVGSQSQRLTFVSGEGAVGVANSGLFGRAPANHRESIGSTDARGMAFLAGSPYEGCVWARAESPRDVAVSLENADGSQILAQGVLHVPGSDQWERLPFVLTPSATEKQGRFALRLTAPGSVVLGYVSLQPGDWGRFKGLPVRRDVVEGLVNQGITVLRYGGSMVNVPDYRWKHMVGPRERRPPYQGNWYPYSTNGWAIPDFLNLCEAAGFLGIPTLNVDETPADLRDFIEYVNGPADSTWGRQRAADGHPAPYNLRYLELGNEEKVDEDYWRKFQPLAEAIWAKDAQVVLVVGDFTYDKPMADPFHFTGASSGITSLAVQQKILALARQHDREVWFDVHVNTESADPVSGSLRALPSYVAAIDKLAQGARHRVVCFELNAERHDQQRALANAEAILTAEGLGESLPVVTSANGLQPDGHNDNDWNQGLLFLDPSRVWLQPPGYVTQMVSRHYEPLLVHCAVTPDGTKLDVCATRSDDGKTLVLQVVNPTDQPVSAQIAVPDFASSHVQVSGEQLTGPLNATNSAAEPAQVVPRTLASQPDRRDGETSYTFAPHSFTILRLER